MSIHNDPHEAIENPSHQEALDFILGLSCRTKVDEDDLATFIIETHCDSFRVTASLTSTYRTIQYKIRKVEKC